MRWGVARRKLVPEVTARKLLFVSLAGIGLAIGSYFLSWNYGSADFPHPGINFSISVAGVCDSDSLGGLTTTCTEGAGIQFSLNLNLNSIPAGFTYNGYDSEIQYSGGVTVVANTLNSATGTPCHFTNGDPGTSTDFVIPCIFGTPSSYFHVLYHIDFKCPSTAPSNPATVTLFNNPGPITGTDLVDAGAGSHGETGTESLTITCGSFTPTATRTATPTPTRTFTPTPTPTFIPHQGNIFPVAGGAASPLNSPQGVVGAADGSLYVSDTGHCQVLNVQQDGTFVVTAGTGTCGYSGDNGSAINAQLNAPTDLALDSTGNLYIADRSNHRVRKVAAGTITTVAGNGSTNYGVCTESSPATGPCLSEPTGVWVDSGNNLYIASWGSHRVMQVSGGTITTFAGNGAAGLCADGSAATGACLSGPWDVVGDNIGNIYISSNQNHVVREVTGGLITTVAGNGTAGACASGSAATGSCLNAPRSIDLNGSDLYIADSANNLIRRVNGITIYTAAGGGTPSPGFCGDFGPPTSACLNLPSGLAVGPGSRLFFTDAGNSRLRLIYSGAPDKIDTMLGPDFCGDGLVAISSSCLNQPADISMDEPGNIYIADPGNHRVRKVDTLAHISTLAGKTEQTGCLTDSGPAADVCLARPLGLTAQADGHVYISDRDGQRIWEFTPPSSISRVAGNGTASSCSVDTSSLGACLSTPRGLAYYEHGGTSYLFVAQESGTVLRINLSLSTVRTVLSDGQVDTDVAVGPDGGVYVAQPNAHLIRRLNTGNDGLVDGGEGTTVVAGTGTAGLATDGMVAIAARLNGPTGVEVDADGHLLISDTGNNRLWVVTEPTPAIIDALDTELIYGVAGGGSPSPGFCGDPKAKATPTPPNPHNAREACLANPGGLFYHDIGTLLEQQFALYFADTNNNRVRKVPSDCDADGLTDKAEGNGLMLKSGLTPWVTPAPMTPTPPPGTVRTDPCNSDTDGDGCTDAQEVGPNQFTGGRRDPTNPWDYMNPTHDRKNRVDDILAVVSHFGKNLGDPGYSRDYDRTYIGPNPWTLGPPDGQIRVNDIIAIIRQYGHDCA
jgi:sugar lactone lactonase YvrE